MLPLLLCTQSRYLLSGKSSLLILVELGVHVSLVLFGAFHSVHRSLCEELLPEPGCRGLLLQSVKALLKEVLEIAQGLPCAFIGQCIFLKTVVCRCLLHWAPESSVHIYMRHIFSNAEESLKPWKFQ